MNTFVFALTTVSCSCQECCRKTILIEDIEFSPGSRNDRCQLILLHKLTVDLLLKPEVSMPPA